MGGVERVGEKVVVRYRPDRPGEAEVDSFFTLWGAASLFGVLGLVFLSVGIAALLGFVPD